MNYRAVFSSRDPFSPTESKRRSHYTPSVKQNLSHTQRKTVISPTPAAQPVVPSAGGTVGKRTDTHVCESWPSTDSSLDDTSHTVNLPEDEEQSAAAKFIERFRYGQPQSREERQNVTSPGETGFWWRKAPSPEGSTLDDSLTLEESLIISPQEHSVMCEPEVLHLQERANVLLERSVHTLSKDSTSISGSVCHHPTSPKRPQDRTDTPNLLNTHTGNKTTPLRPEDDILFQWRLRRKMEEAWQQVQAPPINPTCTYFGPAPIVLSHTPACLRSASVVLSSAPVGSSSTPTGLNPSPEALNYSLADLSSAPAYINFTTVCSSSAPACVNSAPVCSSCALACMNSTTVCSSSAPTSISSTTVCSSSAPTSISSTTVCSSSAPTSISSTTVCSSSAPTSINSTTVCSSSAPTSISSPTIYSSSAPTSISSTTVWSSSAPTSISSTHTTMALLSKSDASSSSKLSVMKHDALPTLMHAGKESATPVQEVKRKVKGVSKYMKVTGSKKSHRERVRNDDLTQCSRNQTHHQIAAHAGEPAHPPSPIHNALGQVVSEVLFPVSTPGDAHNSTPAPSTSHTAHTHVITQLLQDAEDSDGSEFADDPLLCVLRQQRERVKGQISEADALLNELQDD